MHKCLLSVYYVQAYEILNKQMHKMKANFQGSHFTYT